MPWDDEMVARQSGVISRRQLAESGLTPSAIKHLLAKGTLVRIHYGVYAVGHAELSDRGRIVAALLAAGPEAVASHRTAAYLLTLIPTLPAVLDVTVPGKPRRSRPTLAIHATTRRIPTIYRRDLPLTAPLRTLEDLRRARPAKEVERITQEALAKRLVAPHELPGGAAPTRSNLESRMLALIERAGLPEPRVNHPIGQYLVDFAWPDHGVVVEVDGYATHGHRAAFERDRARDVALAAAGYAVLRFTHRQIAREAMTVVARLGAALALSPGSPARARARA